MKTTRPSREFTSRAHGTTYMLILSISMLITVIGLSSITLSRIATRKRAGQIDMVTAQYLARSAIDYTLLLIDDAYQLDNVNWRQWFTSDAESAPIPASGGTFTWMVVDPDTLFDDDPRDSFTVIGKGVHRDAVYTISVDVQATEGAGAPALNCLEVGIAAGDLKLFGGTVNSDQTIHSNDDSQTGTGSQVNADVEAVNQITGSGYNSSTTTGVPPRDMSAASITDHYLSRGTYISYTDLDWIAPAWWIWGDTLSPTSNPFGSNVTNPEGIYIIDCKGNSIGVAEARIVGTLVLLNPGANSQIEAPVTWEPAYANYPALIVIGDMDFEMGNQRVDEQTTVYGPSYQNPYNGHNPNFNPPGTPWQGATNTDRDDNYPSAIAGIVYVSGDATFQVDTWGDTTTIEGVLISGGTTYVKSGATLNILYRDTYFNNPPPGFRQICNGPPRAVPGSLKRVVN